MLVKVLSSGKNSRSGNVDEGRKRASDSEHPTTLSVISLVVNYYTFSEFCPPPILNSILNLIVKLSL